MDTGLLVVTLLSLVSLVLVTMYLSRHLVQINKQTDSILLTLISDLQERNQSLLNQVRAMDPMTLMNLQSTTTNSPLPNSLSEEYLFQTDEAEFERFVSQQGNFTPPLGEAINE